MHRLRTQAWPRLRRELKISGSVIWRSLIKYDETDGEQRAASFAYYAFFALFPLIVLLITVFTSFLGNKEEATQRITAAVQEYLPDQAASTQIIRTIQGVVKSRGKAGAIAFVVLAWSALRFFQALVRGVNRAWGTKEYSWWVARREQIPGGRDRLGLDLATADRAGVETGGGHEHLGAGVLRRAAE